MNCSNHKKELFGHTDMKEVASAISDLHYETLAKLLDRLSDKLYDDASKDLLKNRTKLSVELREASQYLATASNSIESAWKISKPFMENKTTEP